MEEHGHPYIEDGNMFDIRTNDKEIKMMPPQWCSYGETAALDETFTGPHQINGE